MTFYKYYRKNNVELSYSIFHFMSGNPSWFCRIWLSHRISGECYGKNKFQAFRGARFLCSSAKTVADVFDETLG